MTSYSQERSPSGTKYSPSKIPNQNHQKISPKKFSQKQNKNQKIVSNQSKILTGFQQRKKRITSQFSPKRRVKLLKRAKEREDQQEIQEAPQERENTPKKGKEVKAEVGVAIEGKF